ncbi:TetR/AcrR family transcriptional regulator [Glycomyces paridis]|uniref:TetR/AcrR family transcriptional regulator n=1 Tax=Glycomyces paridis TaxID=2126555 RepID=A0A4S8PFH3_9ACTN|nr:TetR/AcrR family transcriptional regulator [Glycomyces paridis]
MTSRAQIVAAARRLIDEGTWEGLTIRRLAAELGIGATTLYHHVRDKEELLLLLLNECTDQIALPELPEDPRERIVAAATAIRDALAEWPWAAEVLAVDGFIGRLGEPALKLVETVLDGAAAAGCSPEQSVHLFRSLWYYTVGEILVRAEPKGPGTAPADRDAFFDALDASVLPRLAAIGERWTDLAARDRFAEGLRAFVDGLLAQAEEERKGNRP